MKRVLMIVTLVAAIMLTGPAYGAKYDVSKKAGDFTVNLRLDKATPVVGENTATIAVRDDKGAEVADAVVAVDYSMPAMSGMPAMNHKTKAILKGKQYVANLNLSMGGSWNVTVKINRAGKTVSAKFSLDAQ